jgi:hypothetical protein
MEQFVIKVVDESIAASVARVKDPRKPCGVCGEWKSNENNKFCDNCLSDMEGLDVEYLPAVTLDVDGCKSSAVRASGISEKLHEGNCFLKFFLFLEYII